MFRTTSLHLYQILPAINSGTGLWRQIRSAETAVVTNLPLIPELSGEFTDIGD
jgi:hypothetical protein